jgi:hypothetical protein
MPYVQGFGPDQEAQYTQKASEIGQILSLVLLLPKNIGMNGAFGSGLRARLFAWRPQGGAQNLPRRGSSRFEPECS